MYMSKDRKGVVINEDVLWIAWDLSMMQMYGISGGDCAGSGWDGVNYLQSS